MSTPLLVGLALSAVAGLLYILGDRRETRADDMAVVLDRFDEDRRLSPFCCRSIVHRLRPDMQCECSVCRADRYEPVTAHSQALAESIQKQALAAVKGTGWA